MIRLSDFRVEHPNLSTTPISIKYGKKRFDLHKNKNSEGFYNKILYEVPENPKSTEEATNNYIKNLKDILDKKTHEAHLLEKINNNVKDIETNRQSPDTVKNRHYSPSHHNSSIFDQPKYTKLYPKLSDYNPILGYTNNRYMTPNRKLLSYGNLTLNNQ
jgi:hypothetical protein